VIGHLPASPSRLALMSGPFRLIVLGLALVLAFARPALTQTLADLLQSSANEVILPEGNVLGQADISGTRVVRGGDTSVLSAPENDAIFAILPGADLHLSNVELLQEGQSRFAIYVDGGNLQLEDCRISGAFEVSIYVSAGTLSVRNCEIDGGLYGIQATPGSTVLIEGVRMTGQGSTAMRVDGSELSLKDVTITDTGELGIVVVSSPKVVADGVTLSGVLKDGIWLQDAATADLKRIVVQVSGRALSVEGGGEIGLEGLLLQGNTGALVLNGVTGGVRLMHARLAASEGATTAVVADVGRLHLSDIAVIGGDTGLYVTGALGDASFERVTVHSQTLTGLFLDAVSRPPDVPPIELDHFRGIGAGTAYPAYFRDSGAVDFTNSALISAGALPFGTEGASSPVFSESALISAPEWVTGSIAHKGAADVPPRFLPVGDLAILPAKALATGTIHLALHEFASALALDPEMGREAAAFAGGGPHDPEVLALALEFAIPVPQEVAADTSAMIQLELSPPEQGWVWDGQAVQIALTGVDGTVTSLVPADFPVMLKAGDYSLDVDGRAAGRVTVAAGASLELPLPDAPFYAWLDAENRKVRGPALYLRGSDELTALMAGFRPLRIGEYWGYTPMFAARRGADRLLAANAIAEGRAAIPELLTEMEALRAAEAWPDFNRRWQRVDMILDIMAQFGTREDAQWLMGLVVPGEIRIDQLEAAVLIETRLDLLEDGATLPAARAHLAAFPTGDKNQRTATTRLVQALARTGLPEGLDLLASLHLLLRSEATDGPPNYTGIIELSRQPPEIAGGIPAVFLDRLVAEVDRYLAGPLPEGTSAPIGIDLWNAAAAALAHEVIYGGPAAPRRLPVPVAASIGPSAWAFADPRVLMQGPLSEVGPPDTQRLNGWTYRLPENICAALAYRPPADRQAIYDILHQQAALAVTFGLIPDEEEGDQAKIDNIYGQVSFALGLVMGECVLSDSVLNSFGRDATGEEQAIFDNLDYEPPWWVRLPRSRALLEAFSRGEDFPGLQGHSAIPHADIEALLQGGDGGYPPLKDLFLVRHRLVSDAFQSNHDLLTYGSERRQFRLRNEGGNGTVTIAGYLDIRPILSNGRLIIAVRHNIRSPDYGGLAAMITEPDRAPYEADNRIRMFEAVTLDRGGVETALVHEGTSASGIHFFAAPWSGGLTDSTLHLSMRFWDATWEVDVPLWASSLAHDQRAGGKVVAP
jgi:hypothetical protein